MHVFLSNNREELIVRCKAKVACRPQRSASEEQLSNGVPLFLEQLIRTLRAESAGEDGDSLKLSGGSGGDSFALSEMGVSATAHGKILLDLGYTVDQVVHDYGDVCQAITDLAVERDAPFSVDEFRTLNRCLDNVIADAVSGFARQRDEVIAHQASIDENQRLGFLVHELRNYLHTATIAFSALEAGKLSVAGSTAGLVKRSHASLAKLLNESISDVRLGHALLTGEPFSVATLVAEAGITGSLYAQTSGCHLSVAEVDPALLVSGNRMLLAAALVNLLQNAFKFTRPGSSVTLTACQVGQRVLIDVQDQCGGLPSGAEANLFKPFRQIGADKSGLGLGLSIAKRSVEADGGTLTVADLPGSGCIFTISLPLHGDGGKITDPVEPTLDQQIALPLLASVVVRDTLNPGSTLSSASVTADSSAQSSIDGEEPIYATPRGVSCSTDAAMLRTLIASVAMGDHAAFRRLYDATSPRLFGMARRLLNDSGRAEDVVQDSFVSVWSNARAYNASLSAPMTWMVAIVRNRAFDYLRRHERHLVTLDDQLDEFESTEIGPEDAAIRGEDTVALRRCLALLTPTQRQAIVLSYTNGLSHSELAATMQLPLGTVKTWIRRGLKKMRGCLDGSDVDLVYEPPLRQMTVLHAVITLDAQAHPA